MRTILRKTRSSAGSDFEPIQMLEVELSRPIPAAPGIDERTGRRYRRALSLVRLHTQPLGLIPIPLGEYGLSAEDYACVIHAALASEITVHVRADGLPDVHALSVSGIAAGEVGQTPRCLKARDAFLSDAPPFVSVIIPTRERPNRLATCLRSILASDYPRDRYEIIVADNAKRTNGTADFVAGTYGDTETVRYSYEERPGSASARNRGLTISRGEFVVFTDDDVVVDRHWLTEMVRAFGIEGDVGAVTGLVVPREIETPAQDWFEQYGGFTLAGYRRRAFNLTNHRLNTPLYPYAAGIYGTGNSMAFRTSLLRAIGAFDPALGNGTPALGGVDSEVLLRTILKGATIVYTPAAIVHHLHRREYTGLQRQMYNYGAGLTAYLLKTLVTNPRLAPDMLSRVPRGVLVALRSPSAYQERKRTDFPRELTRLELRGMLYGPIGYFRSCCTYGLHHLSRGEVRVGAGRSPHTV